jgi:hypothetical protein
VRFGRIAVSVISALSHGAPSPALRKPEPSRHDKIVTDAGLALCHELDAVAREANAQLLAGFSQEEIVILKAMLRRLTSNATGADHG